MVKVSEIGAFSLSQIYWFVIIYLVAHVIHLSLMKWTKWYPESDLLVQRNCVSYILEILVTTPALIGFLIYGWKSLNEDYPLSIDDVHGVIYISVFLCSLYLFEIAYKIRIGYPLLAHHLVTLLLVMLVFSELENHPTEFWIIKCSIFFGLTAVTEQHSFVALFFYRVKYFKTKTVAMMFYVSSVSTFISKTVLIALSTDVWARGSYLFWWITYPILVFGLFVSQAWGAWILWKLGAKMMQRHKKEIEVNVVHDEENHVNIELSAQTVSEFREIDAEANQMSEVYF